jgi:hypothetical protein
MKNNRFSINILSEPYNIVVKTDRREFQINATNAEVGFH